jgi:hypothetical protein
MSFSVWFRPNRSPLTFSTSLCEYIGQLPLEPPHANTVQDFKKSWKDL